MSRIVVVGGSDQGRQTIDVIEAGGVHTVVAVLDPGLTVGSQVGGYPVIDPAGVDAVGADGFVVAVGDNSVRAAAIARVRDDRPDLALVSAIHPTAVIARDAVVGAGALVMAGVVVSNGCVVGDHASLAPGAVTGGNVHIGASTAVGLGANVIHEVTIGAHTVIGAGAVVLDDVPDHVVAFGVPARVVRARAEGEPYLRRRTAG